jgi:hypothetical protein
MTAHTHAHTQLDDDWAARLKSAIDHLEAQPVQSTDCHGCDNAWRTHAQYVDYRAELEVLDAHCEALQRKLAHYLISPAHIDEQGQFASCGYCELLDARIERSLTTATSR